MSLRPGSKEAKELFESLDLELWGKYALNYTFAVGKVALVKKKPELVTLDSTLHGIIVSNANERTPRHIILRELSDIMKWKLIRGQFRPLQKLVDSNNNNAVIDSSTDAFNSLDRGDWKGAISSLTSLKGIGVATASAVLALFAPNLCPFMADEVIEATSSGTRDYSMKEYSRMQASLAEKALQLGESWTAEKVGQALWTRAMSHVHNFDVDINDSNTINETTSSKKRSLEVTNSESDSTSSNNQLTINDRKKVHK